MTVSPVIRAPMTDPERAQAMQNTEKPMKFVWATIGILAIDVIFGTVCENKRPAPHIVLVAVTATLVVVTIITVALMALSIHRLVKNYEDPNFRY